MLRFIFGRPFFALCYRSVVCPVCAVCLSVLSVCSVCDVGVLWPNGWTDRDETWHAGRPRPGHTVLDGDPSPAPLKGHRPPFSAHICCGQMAAWTKMPLGMELGLGPGDFVLDGDPAPSRKGGGAPSPIFDPFLLWPNGWMHQDATWYGGRPHPRGLRVRWETTPLPKMGVEPLPNFWLMSIAAKRLHGSKCHFWYKGRPWSRRHCVRPISIVAKRLDASRCHFVWR